MKKIAIALVLCVLFSSVVGGVALAKAEKVDLSPYPGRDPGGGFVVFNDTSGPDNLQIQMSLKGAVPDTAYDVYVYLGAPPNLLAGTVTTNAQGNVNFHYSASVASGDTTVGLALKRLGQWQFSTGPVPHSFK